jgi:hypothetical protein
VTPKGNLSSSEYVDGEVLQTVNTSLERLLARVTELIHEHRKGLATLADALLEQPLFTGTQIGSLLQPSIAITAEQPCPSARPAGGNNQPPDVGKAAQERFPMSFWRRCPDQLERGYPNNACVRIRVDLAHSPRGVASAG